MYDKPWRAGGGIGDKIYRPSKTVDRDIYGDDVEKLIKSSKYVVALPSFVVCYGTCIARYTNSFLLHS